MRNLSQKEESYRLSKEQYEKIGKPLSEEKLLNWRLDDGLFIPEMTDEHRKEYGGRLLRDSKKTLIMMLVPIAICIILAFINIWLLLVYCTFLFIVQLIFFFKSRTSDIKLKIFIIENYPELEHFQNSHFYKYQKQLRK
jgi:hypothetical protein